MNKSDLNNSMVFKLRGKGLCVLLKDNNHQTFCNKKDIINGLEDGRFSLLSDYDDVVNKWNCSLSNTPYDIIAIKQCKNLLNALRLVLNNQEPDKWDWVEKVKEPVKIIKLEFPSINDNTQNIIINISIDSKDNMEEIFAQLSKYARKYTSC